MDVAAVEAEEALEDEGVDAVVEEVKCLRTGGD